MVRDVANVQGNQDAVKTLDAAEQSQLRLQSSSDTRPQTSARQLTSTDIQTTMEPCLSSEASPAWQSTTSTTSDSESTLPSSHTEGSNVGFPLEVY